jgi:hypothetical protein
MTNAALVLVDELRCGVRYESTIVASPMRNCFTTAAIAQDFDLRPL